MADSRNMAVIGLGTFGAALARELTRMGDRVVGIDKNADCVAARDGEMGQVMQLDASDPRALAQCGLDAHDAVVICIGDDIQASTVAAMNARDLGCAQVWVKASSAAHERILRAVGIDHIMRPEQDHALLVAHKLHNPGLRDVIGLGADGAGHARYVAHLRMPVGGIGKTLDGLGLSKMGLTCLGLVRDGHVLPCDGGQELAHTDGLLLHGRRDDLRAFSKRG